jgi:hypothetical protein
METYHKVGGFSAFGCASLLAAAECFSLFVEIPMMSGKPINPKRFGLMDSPLLMGIFRLGMNGASLVRTPEKGGPGPGWRGGRGGGSPWLQC